MRLVSSSSPSFFHSPLSERTNTDIHDDREQLREQHELTQEIGNAITSMPITEPIDEDELEADLAALEQENLDEKMLKTGTVPVADSLNRLPKAANGERKSSTYPTIYSIYLSTISFKGKRKKKKYRKKIG